MFSMVCVGCLDPSVWDESVRSPWGTLGSQKLCLIITVMAVSMGSYGNVLEQVADMGSICVIYW